MSRRPLRAGFTLIETIIVLLIIAMVSAIGLPRVDFFKYRADAAAVQVRSLLMQAQRDAIVRQHDLVVSIDTAGHRLILSYDQNNDGAIASTERIRTQSLPEQNRFAAPPAALGTAGLNNYGPIRARRLRTMSGHPSVVFRRDGSVSSSLELYTTSQRAIPSDFRVTTVVEATGRTTIMRYTGSAWRGMH